MYSINDLLVEFPGRVLFDRIGFVVNSRDRIGLVGRNGAGKSTLLKIIAGLDTSYSGHLGFPKDKTVGYLVQERSFTSVKTVYEEAESAFEAVQKLIAETDRLTKDLTERQDYESDSYLALSEKLHEITERLHLTGGSNYQEEIEKVLKGLGFAREEMFRPMAEFSGGWQMRVELAKLLLKRPDLLLLDEPTNHLDIESIRWLEGFLQNYPGAVMLVSHDRVLLDNVTTRTIEIQQGKLYDYPANYSDYVELRQERIEQQSAELKNQQREIAQIESFVERFRYKASKAKQVQSRVKRLEKYEDISIEETDHSRMAFRFAPAKESGKIVVEAEQVTKSYGEKLVIKSSDFIIARNERIAFVGQNGQGKSTLVKMIMSAIDFGGQLKLGHNVQIGYFAQNQTEMLDRNKTLFETLEDVADNDTRPKLRNILGSFLFSGEDVEKKVSVLSGGEKTRLALAKMLLQPINFLVLDEPTNHLDMAAKDVLKSALLHFNGTLIVVSHDRDFLSGLTTRIFEFRDHQIRQLDYDINELMEIRDQEQADAQRSQKGTSAEKEISASKQQYLDNKEKDRQKRKIEKQIAEAEESISQIESAMLIIENQLNSPEEIGNSQDYSKLAAQYTNLKKQLEQTMHGWENMHEELTNL
ncbi:MAG: glycosyl transferase family 2 [Bacteroidetes bacterium GWF2_43_63]|nr:MAG: glycosyl transferase family 2 [Bacteroidetes bacterium GWE2_42_42]OFY54628.1 MAG: glycosyl transferase family 2 [Bacteroidetes bacterium GWF2_43_63]HBG71865.1 glycosyl transferase family 2 [Bacteroidales bacterium]HCB61448.1 glycosyl transferase family 2 [Bacteroidales bacterium]HCY23317.1 glycosyl transferase family 2 [Bacteroidales bacterium]